jgi:hypothetical protein
LEHEEKDGKIEEKDFVLFFTRTFSRKYILLRGLRITL